MNSLDLLLAAEEIKQLKARYFRSMDTKNEALYRSVLTEDYTFDAPEIITDPLTGFSPYPDPTTGVLHGRDTCATSIFGAIRHVDYSSVHLGHMPEIEILDADNAKGIWSMSDVITFPRGDGTKVTLFGYGHYHDIYRREDGSWKIALVKLVRTRVDYPFEGEWRERARLGARETEPSC